MVLQGGGGGFFLSVQEKGGEAGNIGNWQKVWRRGYTSFVLAVDT
jgi:hypothetical protein